MLSREGEELLARLRRAKEDLRAAQAKLRGKKPDEAEVREAARALVRVSQDVAVGGALERATLGTAAERGEREPVRGADLRKGAKVYVPRLRAEAEIVEVSADGMVRVAAGPLKLLIAASELLSAAPPPEPPAPKRSVHGEGGKRGRAEIAAAPPEVPIQTSDNSVDLRGLRADDAVALATTFLDRSLNAGRKVAFLVHGHGTGALRESIRKELKESRYVAHFRAGNSDEGGDGVTVVWLA
jgi:DNA mismatch repair protein MutS2